MTAKKTDVIATERTRTRYQRISPFYDRIEGMAERRYHPWRERLWSLVVGSKVLEVGKILMSALTPEELDQLREIISSQALDHLLVMSLSARSDVGNTSVT